MYAPRAVDAALAATEIPSYVLDYAPLVWLHSEDKYRPSGIAEHLNHVVPEVDYEEISDVEEPLTLDNLDQLNALGNESVYLTSVEGIDANPQPDWLFGADIDDNGQTSDTSSIIVVNDHGEGEVDAFYFYYYSYNLGNTVLGMEFGNHIGDWEHNMIRFQDGEPQALWYSQHSRGQAFTYEATEKQGDRPIAYSGNGTHAVYSIAGPHDHTIPGVNLPFGPLVDQTDQGILWDPTLGAYAYSYAADTQTFEAYDSSYPVNWLNFNGRWGDDALQGGPELFGQATYTAGPNGPKFKNLQRDEVCPSSPCTVLPFTTYSIESAGNATAS